MVLTSTSSKLVSRRTSSGSHGKMLQEGSMSAVKKIFFLFATFAAVSVVGCASTNIAVSIEPPYMMAHGAHNDEKQHADAVIKTVMERNKTVESDSTWIAESYEKFSVRDLSTIDENDYAQYAQYLDGGAAYVIMHPAYYAFFEDTVSAYEEIAGMMPEKNAMERFLGKPSFSSKATLIRTQEKLLRDFLEYMSTDRKLVILVLPRDYRDFHAYKYKDLYHDEYMRYINEVTNSSASVIYLYSKTANKGSLRTDDRKRVIKFLQAVNPTAVLLGGGYLGRCLEQFYNDMQRYYSQEKLYVVPEISAISPSDITESVASEMLRPGGEINLARLTENIQNNVIVSQDSLPQLKNLSNASY